jgi:hypothetical protein
MQNEIQFTGCDRAFAQVDRSPQGWAASNASKMLTKRGLINAPKFFGLYAVDSVISGDQYLARPLSGLSGAQVARKLIGEAGEGDESSKLFLGAYQIRWIRRPKQII